MEIASQTGSDSPAGNPGGLSSAGFELPFLDRFQRLETLDSVAGFMPVTSAEQTEVMGLQSVIGKPGGAAKHLAEVAKHQKKAGVEDLGRAPRNIVHLYIDSAQDAASSAIDLEGLQLELREVLNPELVLDRVVEPQKPGLVKFLRFFDLRTLAQTGDIKAVGYDPQKVDYSTNNPGIMFYVGEAISKWTVHQVRQKLPDAINEQFERFSFFVGRLEEVADHSPKSVAVVAKQGLESLQHDLTATE